MKSKKVIQFLFGVYADEPMARLLIEQLRYAGVLSVIKEETTDTGRTEYVLQLAAPKDVDDKVWLDRNVRRMGSFGINAVEVKRS